MLVAENGRAWGCAPKQRSPRQTSERGVGGKHPPQASRPLIPGASRVAACERRALLPSRAEGRTAISILDTLSSVSIGCLSPVPSFFMKKEGSTRCPADVINHGQFSEQSHLSAC